MHLTLEQAAAELGKTPRQVRYLIKTGKLAAQKVGHGWRVDSNTLPRDPAQLEVTAAKREHLRAAVEEALDAKDNPARRGYSFRDLRAAQVGIDLHGRFVEHLGLEHPATRSLALALEHLAQGCHRFRREDKLEAYRAARDEASRCVSRLALARLPASLGLLQDLESTFMPPIGGLLRRAERRDRPS